MVPSSALDTRPRHLDWLAVALAAAAGLAVALLPLNEAGLVLAGAALLLAAAVRPELCLYLAAFAVPFGELRTISIGGLEAGGADLAVALLLAAWLGHGVAGRRLTLRLPPLSWPLLLLLAALALSLFDTMSLQASTKELAKWGEVAVVYVAGASVLQSRRQSVILLACLLAAGTMEALIGAYGSLMRIGPPSYAILGGLVYRASGDFAQPNPFAGYMNQTWPLAAGLLLGMLPPRRWAAAPAGWAVAGPLAALVASAAALGLSWSRGAWLGAAAALAAIMVAWAAALVASRVPAERRAGRLAVGWLLAGTALLAAVALLGAADLLPPAVTERLGSITDDVAVIQDVRTVKVNDANFATVERVAHWWAGWRMWEEHPWTGVGAGNYSTAYPLYNLPGWEDALGHAHNFYINMGAEAGTIGLATYLLFLICCLAVALRRLSQASDPWQRGMALAVLGVLVARIVQDGLDSLWVHSMGVQAALALLLLECPAMPGPAASPGDSPAECTVPG